jgi:hypothetical protein
MVRPGQQLLPAGLTAQRPRSVLVPPDRRTRGLPGSAGHERLGVA